MTIINICRNKCINNKPGVMLSLKEILEVKFFMHKIVNCHTKTLKIYDCDRLT